MTPDPAHRLQELADWLERDVNASEEGDEAATALRRLAALEAENALLAAALRDYADLLAAAEELLRLWARVEKVGAPMRGWLWLARRYGWRRTWRYWRARRQRVLIDYGRVFSVDELARLEEHDLTPPWRRP